MSGVESGISPYFERSFSLKASSLSAKFRRRSRAASVRNWRSSSSSERPAYRARARNDVTNQSSSFLIFTSAIARCYDYGVMGSRGEAPLDQPGYLRYCIL